MLRILLVFIITLTIYADDKSLEKVTIHLGLPHEFQFAGYYIAKEKGYFKENNLDVTLKENSKNINLINLVKDKSSTYGIKKLSFKNTENNKLLFLFDIFQNTSLNLLDANKKIRKSLLSSKKSTLDNKILFTSKIQYKTNPRQVEKVYNSIKKGWEYTFNNIEETSKIIFDNYNLKNKSLKDIIDEINKLEALINKKNTILTQNTQKKPLLNKKEIKYLENNNITFLTNSDYEPLTMYSDNKLSGIEIDFIKLIEKKIDKKFEYKILDKNDKQIKHLLKNPNSFKYRYSKYDTNKKLTILNSINKIKIALVTNIKTPYIENIKLLNNKTIAITKYSSIHKNIKSFYPNLTFIYTKSLDESLKLLAQKKVYGVFGKLPVISYKINKNYYTNMKISGTIPFEFDMELLTNVENTTLKNILNKAILSIKNEEKFNILSKYNLVKYESYIDYSWIYKASIPLILIIIVILLINLKLKKEIKKRKEAENKLLLLVNIDSLTNIFNRRKIDELYKKEFEKAKRYNSSFSVIFFDIDDFKYINDTYGHKIGDEILINISKIIKENIRGTDYYGRWGGDEFIILLPQTSKLEAKNVINHMIVQLKEFNDLNVYAPITCSFGVAEYEKNDTIDSLLKKADKDMYLQKNKK